MQSGTEAVAGRGQLVSWTEDILFTRLDIHDPHWKISRKTLARAFSADEIRRAHFREVRNQSQVYTGILSCAWKGMGFAAPLHPRVTHVLDMHGMHGIQHVLFSPVAATRSMRTEHMLPPFFSVSIQYIYIRVVPTDHSIGAI